MTGSVPPKAIAAVLSHLEAGGSVIVPTCTRCTIIKQKNVLAFRKAGYELLREDGEGYRMQTGNTSVYLLPGQLRFV